MPLAHHSWRADGGEDHPRRPREQLEGLPALNRVWEAPDNLPTYAELKDPFVWIDRVLKQA